MVSIGFSIKSSTKGIDRMIRSIKKISQFEIVCGILEGTRNHPEAELPYAHLLALHELSDGSHYPRRPVLGISHKNHHTEWEKVAVNAIRGLFNRVGYGKSLTYPQIASALRPVPKMMESQIKKTFGSSELARNHPSTIARKGNSTPMVESGKLRSRIRGKVARKD